ncbi:MAG: hypothetical protein KatS3mg030_469 [Saprospiraceae bacterium]|nr:MAG: hypothetical protein KatS3mg030_469 [Saprospiraceae bacterium]
MNQNGLDRKKKVQYLLFFLVLFILPAASLYFLNSGKNYRLQALSELQELGRVADFRAIDQMGRQTTPQSIRRKVVVMASVPNQSDSLQFYTRRLGVVHQAYDETNDLLLIMAIRQDSAIDLAHLAIELGIKDADQWRLVKAPAPQVLDEAFHVHVPARNVALVDTSGMVRKLYNIYDNHEMGRLMEHIALIIPKQPRRR